LLTEAYGFTVLRIGGKVLFQGHVRGKHCIFPWAAASADGSRFTISIGRLTGVNIEVLDLGRYFAPWRVVVFDTRNHKPVGRSKLAWRAGLALSRDGSMIVYAEDGMLRLFGLPGGDR
jgi:hypothetical protein